MEKFETGSDSGTFTLEYSVHPDPNWKHRELAAASLEELERHSHKNLCCVPCDGETDLKNDTHSMENGHVTSKLKKNLGKSKASTSKHSPDRQDTIAKNRRSVSARVKDVQMKPVARKGTQPSKGRSQSVDAKTMQNTLRFSATLSMPAQMAALSCYEDMLQHKYHDHQQKHGEDRKSVDLDMEYQAFKWKSARDTDQSLLSRRRLSMQLNAGMSLLDKLKLEEDGDDLFGPHQGNDAVESFSIWEKPDEEESS